MIGSLPDVRCKQNRVKPITRKVCRHNCKYWKLNKCELGY